jgi:hypothetical protein
MDTKRIDLLLQRYYEGQSSLEEEKELISFFSEHDVPEHLILDKACFLAQKEIQLTVPSNLGSTLEQNIDQWDQSSKKNRILSWSKWSLGIAACTLAVFMAVKPIFTETTSLSPEEKILCQQANDALYKFSSLFNKGLDKLQVLKMEKKNIETHINK